MQQPLRIKLDSNVQANGRIVTFTDDEMFILAIGATEARSPEDFVVLDTATSIEEARQLHNDAILWVHHIDDFPWTLLEGDDFAVALAQDYARYVGEEDARLAEAEVVNAAMADNPMFGRF